MQTSHRVSHILSACAQLHVCKKHPKPLGRAALAPAISLPVYLSLPFWECTLWSKHICMRQVLCVFLSCRTSGTPLGPRLVLRKYCAVCRASECLWWVYRKDVGYCLSCVRGCACVCVSLYTVWVPEEAVWCTAHLSTSGCTDCVWLSNNCVRSTSKTHRVKLQPEDRAAANPYTHKCTRTSKVSDGPQGSPVSNPATSHFWFASPLSPLHVTLSLFLFLSTNTHTHAIETLYV